MLASQRPKASREYRRLRARARTALIAKDWSVRRAAIFLERDYVHLARVLSGQRISERLLVRIIDLPPSPVKRSRSGFALRPIKSAA